MVSELKEPRDKLLEQSLVFKLKLIKEITEFSQTDSNGEEEEIQDLVKQLTHYNSCAQTLRNN